MEERALAPDPQHVDNRDQLSSMTLLGLAVLGGLLTTVAYLLGA